MKDVKIIIISTMALLFTVIFFRLLPSYITEDQENGDQRNGIDKFLYEMDSLDRAHEKFKEENKTFWLKFNTKVYMINPRTDSVNKGLLVLSNEESMVLDSIIRLYRIEGQQKEEQIRETSRIYEMEWGSRNALVKNLMSIK